MSEAARGELSSKTREDQDELAMTGGAVSESGAAANVSRNLR